MSYGRYQTAQVSNAVGQALAGVEVYFLTQPADVTSLTPLATVYSNSTGAGGAITQPLLTDGLGQFAAYLTPGVYTVVYVVPTSGTFSYPDQNISYGGGTAGTVTFDEIGSGDNTTAAMIVGSGASLGVAGSGTIAATSIDGVTVTGTPGTGQVLTATSPTAANWQTPSSAGLTPFSGILSGAVDGTNRVFTLTNGGTPLTTSPVAGTVIVWLNYPLVNGVGYTLSGITVTFTSPPQSASGGSPADVVAGQGFIP